MNLHLADPRHHASIKPKVMQQQPKLHPATVLTLSQAASIFEKFPHIRRIVAQVAAHPGAAASPASAPVASAASCVLQPLRRGTQELLPARLQASPFNSQPPSDASDPHDPTRVNHCESLAVAQNGSLLISFTPAPSASTSTIAHMSTRPARRANAASGLTLMTALISHQRPLARNTLAVESGGYASPENAD